MVLLALLHGAVLLGIFLQALLPLDTLLFFTNLVDLREGVAFMPKQAVWLPAISTSRVVAVLWMCELAGLSIRARGPFLYGLINWLIILTTLGIHRDSDSGKHCIFSIAFVFAFHPG